MRRHGAVVALLATAASLALGALVVGTAVAVCTRVATSARLPAVLAAPGAWAWAAYAVALVLLVPVALLATGQAVRWARVGAVLALAGLVVQVVWLAPRFGAEAGGRTGLTVMTANLEYGGADAETVVDIVRERGVDLLALEEVTPAERVRLRSAGLDRLLGHAVGRTSTGADGTMVFSRWPLRAVSGVPVTLGGVAATVDAPRPVTVLAVHATDPLFRPGEWAGDLATVGAAARRAAPGRPVVVAGDLNTTMDHAPLRRVLARSGLRDAAEQAGSGFAPTWPHDRGVPPFLTLDHVLTRGLVAVRTDRVDLPGSDHRALLADL